jgi:DNA polymerase-3 subunit alpha
MSDFVHLRVHTEYSLVDSIVRVAPLLDSVKSLGMPAVAMTDQGNVSALVKFYQAAIERGIKPIVGADIWVGRHLEDPDPARLTLLCLNRGGYLNLSHLLTRSYEQGRFRGRALVARDWLSASELDGLIALSGGQQGELGRILSGSHPELAAGVVDTWRELMPGRFYIELQRLGRPGEAEYIRQAVDVAASRRVPLLATNDVRFLSRDEFIAHETRVCIAEGRTLEDPDRPRAYTEEQYLKSTDAMLELFADLPEALENTIEIARRCSLELDLGHIYLPSFELERGTTARQHLEMLSRKRLRSRLEKHRSAAPELYEQRLERELEVICKMGFEGYFLIVADFIAWSRRNSIPVGPGRGSGAGSLVAYALGITSLDPIEHELLFERFLNPERVSMPDFDIDFCIDGRDRVIEYVTNRYGRDRVSQIITHGTMSARAVVRDVGRALGMPYGYVDRIAKLIPHELGIKLEKALDNDEELRAAYDAEEDVQTLIDRAMQLEGLARNAGTHAGGIVIAPEALTEFMPLYADENSGRLTQLDKDDVEAIGLVKFDFLGLKTLTIIDKAVRTVNRQRSEQGLEPIDIETLPVDDPETYELLKRCQTTAIFQLESRGMRELIKRLQPDCFDDLVAILALFRPGPLQTGMVDEFIDRKHGRNSMPIDYLHPELEALLRPTYGVILYQEQVMQIAQILAGYSLGGADLLRRAMGKKKPEEMAQQRSVFLEGSKTQNVDGALATHIFDLMEKFAGYGFNKSHSAAYALVAYQTAWLKTHYPAAFMAAAMSADMDYTDKLVVLKDDCAALGIELVPPSINESELEFSVDGDTRILYGLGAIKGVGRAAVESMLAERSSGGPFTSLLDLCYRVGPHELNRRMLEALVRSGAVDALGMNRATAMNAIPDALRLAERSLQATAAGQAALFADDSLGGDLDYEFTEIREWSAREKLEAERESLGLYLTGHPFSDFAAHCAHFTNGTIAQVLSNLPSAVDNFYRVRKDVTVAGAVMDVRRQGNFVSIVLDDDTERIEATLFDDVLQRSRHLVSKHAILVVKGQIRYDDYRGGWRLTAQRVQSVDDAIEDHARRLTICIGKATAGAELIKALRETLKPFAQGSCEVCVQFQGRQARAEITLSEDWAVRPTRELREQLTHLLGEDRFSLHYAKHILHH